MKQIAGFLVIVLIGLTIWYMLGLQSLDLPKSEGRAAFWELQGIDTTKYSRDLAREKLNDDSFNDQIKMQMDLIAKTGATHVAIGTPYDDEFLPFLTQWVEAARLNHLNVWFRGNWSGWEGWFGYERINRAKHIQLTYDFIVNHAYLFERDDIFSACTECENGGPGDPRYNGDITGHREFLIEEYNITKKAFQQIGRTVKSNYVPMNADVALIIMDKETTKQLGGIVVIDHYIASPEKYAQDINIIAEQSGGKIVLGEFGAPIADIHGEFTSLEQAQWIDDVLENVVPIRDLAGVNYWGAVGGETQVWNSQGQAHPAVGIITSYYKPKVVRGYIKNELGRPVAEATVSSNVRSVSSTSFGHFQLPVTTNDQVEVVADGYNSEDIDLNSFQTDSNMVLKKYNENLLFRVLKLF